MLEKELSTKESKYKEKQAEFEKHKDFLLKRMTIEALNRCLEMAKTPSNVSIN